MPDSYILFIVREQRSSLMVKLNSSNNKLCSGMKMGKPLHVTKILAVCEANRQMLHVGNRVTQQGLTG